MIYRKIGYDTMWYLEAMKMTYFKYDYEVTLAKFNHPDQKIYI